MVVVVFAARWTQVQKTRELMTTLTANEVQVAATRPAFIPIRFIMSTTFTTLNAPGIAVCIHGLGRLLPVLIRQGCIQFPFWKQVPERNYPFPH